MYQYIRFNRAFEWSQRAAAGSLSAGNSNCSWKLSVDGPKKMRRFKLYRVSGRLSECPFDDQVIHTSWHKYLLYSILSMTKTDDKNRQPWKTRGYSKCATKMKWAFYLTITTTFRCQTNLLNVNNEYGVWTFLNYFHVVLVLFQKFYTFCSCRLTSWTCKLILRSLKDWVFRSSDLICRQQWIKDKNSQK